MEKTVYKVVYCENPRNDGDFVEYFSLVRSPNTLRYVLGEETNPILPYSKIFCFATFENARSFFHHYSNCRFTILEGIGKNPKRLLKSCCYIERQAKFWLLKKQKKGAFKHPLSGDSSRTWTGTVVVDSFLPQREVTGE